MDDFINIGEVELVPSEWGCPNCGERIVDELIIFERLWRDNDDAVHPVHCK